MYVMFGHFHKILLGRSGVQSNVLRTKMSISFEQLGRVTILFDTCICVFISHFPRCCEQPGSMDTEQTEKGSSTK